MKVDLDSVYLVIKIIGGLVVITKGVPILWELYWRNRASKVIDRFDNWFDSRSENGFILNSILYMETEGIRKEVNKLLFRSEDYHLFKSQIKRLLEIQTILSYLRDF